MPRRQGRKKPPVTERAIDSMDEGGIGARARLFWNGRSQAVRLPREFRFDGDEVSIRREGRSVILEPVHKPEWPAGYWERIDALTRDFDFPEVEPLGARLREISLDANQ